MRTTVALPQSLCHRGTEITRIEFRGEFADGIDELMQAVNEALAEPAAPSIVFDLREVTHLDDHAVGRIVAIVEKVRNVGVRPTILSGHNAKVALEQAGLRALLDD